MKHTKDTLRYFALRRFPPREVLSGRKLDRYVEGILCNPLCRQRIESDIVEENKVTIDG